MHVGRTVSGLPPGSHKFAVLPPHFGKRDEFIESGIACVFPGLPSQLAYVGEFCLASLVYHAEYLKTNLDPKHPLLETTLFQHPTLITELSAKVCDIDTSDRLQATGVPPHVAILREIKSLLNVALEQRAIGAGVVTFDGLDTALKRCLDGAGHPNNPMSTPTFFWNGKFRRVPPDFELPDCSVAMLWVLWQCGNASKKTPPLRMLDGRDMPNRNLQKRLSDARYLMRMVEDEAKRTGNRKRRRGQLSWISVVALHRRAHRKSH
eukprot:jgi/Phyca11/118431/e_gw1.36.382.1